MGLLDDAIREHLDLKRRRGADPAEIERAAQEALGPVRRNRDLAAAGSADELVADDDRRVGSAWDEPDDGVASDLVDEEGPVIGPPGFGADDEPASGDDPFDDEPFSETDPATRVMRTTDIPAPADRTAEFDVEEALATGEPGPADVGDEDVLEETPEFLQDTPDHDRLWFEQRPPRDFDFDG